jgi:hypothetical protein
MYLIWAWSEDKQAMPFGILTRNRVELVHCNLLPGSQVEASEMNEKRSNLPGSYSASGGGGGFVSIS